MHFKHYYRDYLLHPFVKSGVHIGDLVRVDADRGEDIGHVTAVSALNGLAPASHLGYILRLATAEEKYMLPIKAKEEWAALEVWLRIPLLRIASQFLMTRIFLIY